MTSKEAPFAVNTLRKYVENQANISLKSFKDIVLLKSVIDTISHSCLKQITIESFQMVL